MLTLQLLVEEKPRLQLPPRLKGKESSQGLTHLASVSLRAVSALVSPMDDDPAAPSGLNVQLSVEDVQLLDLQGCVEHRNVLVGNRRPHPMPQRPGPRPQRSGLAAAGTRPSAEQQWQGAEQQRCSGSQRHEDEPCRLELICQVPASLDSPVQMVLSLQDPCITFMRKFVNNVLYAVFAIIKGAKGDTSSVAAAAAAAVAAPDASAAGAAAAQAAVAALATPQRRPPPVVIIKV